MTKPPYPNFPPNYTKVEKYGGYDREVVLLELRTLGKLSPERLAQIEDAVSMAISKFQDVESHEVVRSDNCNLELRRVLRL